MHMRIIRIDSTPEAIESNAAILLIKKKSIQAKIKNNPQIGKATFFISPAGTA